MVGRKLKGKYGERLLYPQVLGHTIVEKKNAGSSFTVFLATYMKRLKLAFIEKSEMKKNLKMKMV